MNEFKVEKNIPMPQGRAGSAKYPFDKLEVGDSFFIPGVKGREFAGTAYSNGKRNRMKFSVRSVAGGCRCWRVE